MKEKYITITGFRYYSGSSPFRIGYLVRCRKEPDNPYDSEAIKCTMPMLGTVGYVANSSNTVAGGTMSAGRIYDKIGKKFYVRVMFTTFTKIICRVEEGDAAELKKEILTQVDDDWDDDDDDAAVDYGDESAVYDGEIEPEEESEDD